MRSLPTESVEDFSSALFPDLLVSPHSSESVGRLQMANDFHHTPVLAREILELMTGLLDGLVVDATVGGAGHASLILRENPHANLLGIDRDPLARDAARSTLESYGSRALVVAGTFGQLDNILRDNASFVGDRRLGGILLDLGVSSPQLDDPSRGFSYRANAPLDMRMDPTSGPTAHDVINTLDQTELTRLLHRHGETRFAGAIARSIKQSTPSTTNELVAAIERAVPMGARRRGHVATRVFQALRVEVNAEEEELDSALRSAMTLLAPGGVLAVISYHSGEDRVVKAALHDAATGGCVCPAELGCVCGAVATMRVKKASAIMASADEIATNPRARSARLRAGWRLES